MQITTTKNAGVERLPHCQAASRNQEGASVPLGGGSGESTPMPSAPAAPARRLWDRFMPHIAIILAVLAVWGHTVRFGFVWDDRWFIQDLRSIRSLSNIPGMFLDREAQSSDPVGFRSVFRPLRTVVYAALYQLGGGEPPKPWIFHLCNLIWHTASALLLFQVAQRLYAGGASSKEAGGGARWLALLTALGFAVNPVVSETVCWAKALDDLMATTFVLASFKALQGWKEERASYWSAVGWYALAVYSKVSAVPFAMVSFFIFYRLHGAGLMRAARLSSGFFAVGVVYMLHERLVTGGTAQCAPISGSYGQTLLDMLPVVGTWLRLLMGIPPFCADYTYMKGGFAWTALPVLGGAALLLAAAGAAAWALRKPSRAGVGLGLVWVGLFMMPVSNLIPMQQYLAERFLYLPLAGWLLGLGAALAGLQRPGKLGVAGVVIAVWACLAWNRSFIWADNLTLFGQSYAATPHSERVKENAVAAVFDLPTLKPLFQPNPRNKGQFVPVANKSLTQADWDAGRLTLAQSLQLVPDDVNILSALGIACANMSDLRGAVRAFKAAAALRPKEAQYWANLARAANDAGLAEEAQAALDQALQLEPDNLPAWQTAASAAWQRNDFKTAQKAFEKLLQLDPGNAETREWLEKAREKAKRSGPQ